MLEAMGTGEGGVPGGDGSGRSEGSECGEHRRHRILAGRPQRFMPRDPTRLIPATRNGGGGGEGEATTARESGYHAPRMDRITASLGSIWARRQRRRRIGGNRIRATRPRAARTTQEARTRGADWLFGAARGRFGVSLILLFFSSPDTWARIVGSQYAVRRYWDPETDKLGVVL